MAKFIGAQSTQARINDITMAREPTMLSNTNADSDGPVLTEYDYAATFNQTFEWESSTGLPTYIGDLVGTTVRGNPVRPHGPNQPGTVAWQLDSGAQLTPHKGVITYSFLDTAHTTGMYNRPQEGFTEGLTYSSFSPQQQAAARISMQNWDDLIAVTIKEVNGSGGADITLANTQTGPAQAWAYVPYDYAEIYTTLYGPRYNAFHRYEGFVGDVWIADPAVNGTNAQLLPGQYGLHTLNHEIGHSLGLSHPGNYDFGDDQDGDGEPDPITYEGDAQYFQDSGQFTIMSYFDSYETGAQPVDWNLMRLVYASTPMVDDVFVIQQKYGADYTTRAGNTTYGFNSTADVTNAAMKFNTGEMATVFTIWDGGGTDTLNLSGYYTDSVIDLREGGYSSVGGWGAYNPDLLGIDPADLTAAEALALINANNAAAGMGPRNGPASLGVDYFYKLYFEGGVSVDGELLNGGRSWLDITGTGDKYLMEQNIGIAYGAVIENAIGGHGDDRINGNQASNSLTGGAGDDTFIIASYSGVLPKAGGGTRTVTDTMKDTITDFGNGDDLLDLTAFASKGVHDLSDVSWNAQTKTLTIDTNGDGAFGAGDFQVVINGLFVPTTDDILFG